MLASGDKDNPTPFTQREARTILRLPVVDKMMERRRTINTDHWDIPYLAGYSKDGSKIYVDRDLSDWEYKGRRINTDRFLAVHEEVEKALIEALQKAKGHDLDVLLACLRMKTPHDKVYFHCHGVATCAEQYAVEMAHGAASVAAYNHFMKSQVKRAEDERIRHVPADLDMLPYAGSDTQDVRLRRTMKRAMA